MLASDRIEELRQRLEQAGKPLCTYWVCAFSVNQHAGICAQVPFEGFTGVPWVPCDCGTAKHSDGELSEMDKFDEMMAYLKAAHRQSGGRFSQVVAVDLEFKLLTRVWCIAELL